MAAAIHLLLHSFVLTRQFLRLHSNIETFANNKIRDLSKPSVVGLLESHPHFHVAAYGATARTRPPSERTKAIEDM